MRPLVLLCATLFAVACESEGPSGVDGASVNGRWIYVASEMTGTQVTCSTTEVTITLVQSPSLQVDAVFEGTTFNFQVECSRGEQTATLLFTEGTTIENGEIDDGRVSFDFASPDFLHTGTLEGSTMSGTLATRLDLSDTPISNVGEVNLVGTWQAVRVE